MNRLITYQCQKYDQGAYDGKIVVVKPSKGAVRFSVGALTKEANNPRVRTWENSFGRGIAIDLWVPEDQAKLGFDHWALVEQALHDRFMGTEIIFED